MPVFTSQHPSLQIWLDNKVVKGICEEADLCQFKHGRLVTTDAIAERLRKHPKNNFMFFENPDGEETPPAKTKKIGSKKEDSE
jgi:hypothetical protein